MAVLLAVLSSMTWGAADFLGGLMSRRRPAYAVVAASQALGLVAVTIAALVVGAYADPTGWLPWAVGAGISGTVGLLCFYAALGMGTMGVVSSIAALGALVPVAVGVLLGDRPSALATAGIALAVAGAVGASGPDIREGTASRPLLLAVAAAVAFGGALTFIERGARYSSLMTLTGMRVVSVSVFVVAALALRTVGGLERRDLPQLAAIGVGDVGANLMFAAASQRGLLSITGALGSLYPVVTALLARIVLDERLRRVQQLGVAAAVGGVVLVSVG